VRSGFHFPLFSASYEFDSETFFTPFSSLFLIFSKTIPDFSSGLFEVPLRLYLRHRSSCCVSFIAPVHPALRSSLLQPRSCPWRPSAVEPSVRHCCPNRRCQILPLVVVKVDIIPVVFTEEMPSCCVPLAVSIPVRF